MLQIRNSEVHKAGPASRTVVNRALRVQDRSIIRDSFLPKKSDTTAASSRNLRSKRSEMRANDGPLNPG